jgi:hypothetical protein
MSLKLNRGVVAPSGILAEGEPYYDTASDILWLGDGAVNTPFFSGNSEPDIKVAEGTIPAITADNRQVVEIELGALNNPHKALIGFFLSTAVDAEIQAKEFTGGDIGGGIIIPTGVKDRLAVMGGSVNSFYIPRGVDLSLGTFNSGGYSSYSHILVVTEDYLKAERMTRDSNSKEAYGDTPTALPITGFSYESINVGVLIGQYTLAGNGAFLVDKLVECESAWLTTVAGVTTLSIALYNRDSGANTAKDFKVAVYE